MYFAGPLPMYFLWDHFFDYADLSQLNCAFSSLSNKALVVKRNPHKQRTSSTEVCLLGKLLSLQHEEQNVTSSFPTSGQQFCRVTAVRSVKCTVNVADIS